MAYVLFPLTPAPLPWRERDKGRGGFIVGEGAFTSSPKWGED
jgi:hypothetical protein